MAESMNTRPPLVSEGRVHPLVHGRESAFGCNWPLLVNFQNTAIGPETKRSMRYGGQIVSLLVVLGAWQMYLYHGVGGGEGQSISSYVPQVLRDEVGDLQQALGAQAMTFPGARAAAGSKGVGCQPQVKEEFAVRLTEREETTRQRIMASVSKELAPVVAKLGPKGMMAIVVDCVHKFVDMCLNLALSAAKIGIEGVVIVTTTPEMCPRFKEVLGEYSFCVNSTDAYNIAHKHLMETNNCLRPFHKREGWRWGAGSYSRNHGSMVEIMVTRSFMWYELTSNGIGIIAADADVAFHRNPITAGIIDPSRFSLELSYAATTRPIKFSTPDGKGCKSGYPNILRRPDGVKLICGALPPPYIAQPSASWWFDRHTRLAMRCQFDIQTDTGFDLDRFYPDNRETFGEGTINFTVGAGGRSITTPGGSGGLKEFQGALNMSYFEPLPAECAGVGPGLRYLPMDTIIERCSHGPSPINFTKVDNGMPIAIHANCATGAKEKVDKRIEAKHIWIESSGLWFLDEVKKEGDGEKDAESR